jgi:hypothetical protein
VLDGLDADAEAFIIWAWQHRHKLLQLFWNHHTFERGKRAGSSPLELAEVLDQLFCQMVYLFFLPPPQCRSLTPSPNGSP